MLARCASIDRAADAIAEKKRITFVGIALRSTPRKSPNAGCASLPQEDSLHVASNLSSWCTIPWPSHRKTR